MNMLILVATIAALSVPVAAGAESVLAAPASPNATLAGRVDFRVVVPRVLYLRIGTGSGALFSNDSTVDLIDFAVPAANIGDGTAIAASAGSGDQGNGAITVRVLGNGGDIQLTSATSGPLNNGNPVESIGWDRIAVTPAALSVTTPNFTNGIIPHPSFNLGPAGGYSSTILTATNKMVRREGKWTYAYANTDPVPPGTYGGVNINKGRVSYTATLP